MAIVDLLAKITKDGQASDIFIVAGRPLSYKSHGQIMTEGTDRLLPPDTSRSAHAPFIQVAAQAASA